MLGALPSWAFQSTLPRGERQSTPDNSNRSYNFNPRSHEGSDLDMLAAEGATYSISIHAPTRGATVIAVNDPPADPQFQSTLPRGERLHPDSDELIRNVFQSTLPRGERLHAARGRIKEQEISIHAPTRGATKCHYEGKMEYAIFQSTLPRGERHLST